MSFARDPKQIEALRGSEEVVGQLYPAIKSDRTGRTVSGEHRLLMNPKWRVEVRHFKNDFEEELARIEANTQRQVSEGEQKVRFEHLAQACSKDLGIEPAKVCTFLGEKLKNRYTERWIRSLLDDKWKGNQGAKKTEVTSDSTIAVLDKIDREGVKLRDAIDQLGNELKIDEKTYGIGQGCLCPNCPRKDECF